MKSFILGFLMAQTSLKGLVLKFDSRSDILILWYKNCKAKQRLLGLALWQRSTIIARYRFKTTAQFKCTQCSLNLTEAEVPRQLNKNVRGGGFQPCKHSPLSKPVLWVTAATGHSDSDLKSDRISTFKNIKFKFKQKQLFCFFFILPKIQSQ